MKKVLSSQDSMVATQLSTPQKRALAKQFQNPTPLNQWEKLLNSLNIRTGATPQDLFRVLTNLSTQCMETEKKWHLEKKGDIPITSKKKVPTTCFGFYHGNKSSVVSKDYTDQVQKILLSPLKKGGLLFMEDIQGAWAGYTPEGITHIKLPPKQSLQWYLLASTACRRMSEIPEFPTCELPPPTIVKRSYARASDVETNNKSLAIHLLPSASVAIYAVRDYETPTNPASDTQRNYIFSWTHDTLYSAEMAAKILRHLATKPVDTKKGISIGCGKNHESQIMAFISKPQFLYEFLIGWTKRLNDLHQKYGIHISPDPIFDLKPLIAQPTTAEKFSKWMDENPDFFA